MKRYLVLLVSSIACLIPFVSNSNTVSSSSKRVWEIAEDNLSLGDLVESKVCELDIAFDGSFAGTFTMLDELLDKVCTIDSKVDVVDNELETVNSLLVTLDSKIDVVDSEIETIITILDDIRVNDFGGTWTALDELQSTLCSKFDLSFSDLDVIESKLDVLAATQETHFIDTFTLLQVIADNVLETTVQLESLSEQLITDLSEVDVCIMVAKDIMTTVDSKLDVIDVELEINFAGTFTAIDTLQQKACTIASKLDELEIVIQSSQSATFTALAQVEEKLCTIESKVDVVDTEMSEIDSFVDEILENMETSESKACLLDSELDVVVAELCTVESKVEVVSVKVTAIEGDINIVSGDINNIIAKTCTIESTVDVIDHIRITTESKVDIFNNDLITIESKIDTLTMVTLFSKICTLDSRIDIIDTILQTVSSSVDIIDENRITIESTIDVIDAIALTILSKLCTIDSKVEVIDNEIATANDQLLTLESKVDALDSDLDAVCINIETLESNLNTVDSKIDVIDAKTSMILSKACTIDSHIDVIDSKFDLLGSDIGISEEKAIGLSIDMQETWTVLAAIEEKVCVITEQEFTIISKLDVVEFQADLSGVFTVIDTINQKACDASDGAIILESKVDVFSTNCITDLGSTFTAISAVEDKLCTVDSQVDVLLVNIQNISDSSGTLIGTPLTPTDFSDTFSITEPGRYFLTEDINFNPGGNSAIYVDADDVHIDMCDRTIRQIGSNSDITGIIVAENITNFSLENGIIENFTGRSMITRPIVRFVRIKNMVFIGKNTSQIDNVTILDNPGGADNENILIRDTVSLGSAPGINSDCIDINDTSGLFVFDSMFNDATGSGLRVNRSRYFCLKSCITNNNNQGSGGIPGGIALNNGAPLAKPNANFVVESCKSFFNRQGIILTQNLRNGVIKDCICNDNSLSGILFRLLHSFLTEEQRRVCVVHNIFSGNTLSGVHISDVATDNYFAFNQMWENGSTSFLEDSGEGPNSVLGNFAFKSAGTNYSGGNTTINTVALQEDAAFPTPEPKYWINVDMLPT